MIGEFVLDVGRGDLLIFSENIAIGIASSGDGEDSVRRGGVTFYLVRANANVDDEGGKVFNLPVPRFLNWHAGAGICG